MTVRIVTDSTCDLPPEVVAEHKISVVPLYVNFGSESYRDGVDLTRDQFYARLPGSHLPPTTSAPGTDAFVEVYRRLIAEGATGIVSIHIGSSLSNVFNVAQMAAPSITAVPVRVIDGGQITLGTGFLVVHAARLAASGASPDEIVAAVQALAERTYSYAALDTLEYLRRGGRVNLIMFSVGTLLRMKPMLKMHLGKVVTDRARTSSWRHRPADPAGPAARPAGGRGAGPRLHPATPRTPAPAGAVQASGRAHPHGRRGGAGHWRPRRTGRRRPGVHPRPGRELKEHCHGLPGYLAHAPEASSSA